MPPWTSAPLRERVINLDRRRVAVRAADRRPGPYPYYGASGIVDYVDDYLFEGLYLLVAEDGENLHTRNTPVAFLADGRFWVNNHAHVLAGTSENDTRFLAYVLESTDVGGFLTGSTQPKLTQEALGRIPIAAPPLGEQQAIAATLGALDDKIDCNRRAIGLLDELAQALWLEACAATVRRIAVNDLIDAGTLVVGDGYRAKNSELGPDGLPFARAANLRDGFDLNIADRLDKVGVSRAGDKVSRPGDVVLTSKGTVGRFAYVSESVQAMVYSPQLCYWRSLDREALPPSVLYYWLRSRDAWQQISTRKSQTDMADYVSLRDQRSMQMLLPPSDVVRQVADPLDALLSSASSRRTEIGTLASLRDALLPELLSGRMRVTETHEAIAKSV
jgi:type I restriction enzyme, S subunit